MKRDVFTLSDRNYIQNHRREAEVRLPMAGFAPSAHTVIGGEMLGRIAHPLTQSLAEFVLTERMRVRSLGSILARRIGLLRIEAC